MALYVDEILLMSTSNWQEEIMNKKKLRTEIEITDLGPARYFLGTRITKYENKITFDRTLLLRKYYIDFRWRIVIQPDGSRCET